MAGTFLSRVLINFTTSIYYRFNGNKTPYAALKIKNFCPLIEARKKQQASRLAQNTVLQLEAAFIQSNFSHHHKHNIQGLITQDTRSMLENSC